MCLACYTANRTGGGIPTLGWVLSVRNDRLSGFESDYEAVGTGHSTMKVVN